MPAEATPPVDARGAVTRRRLRLLLNIVLVAGSFLYIAYATHDRLDDLRRLPFPLTALQCAGLLLMSVAGIAFSSIYHALAIRRLQDTTVATTRLGLAYALGQIVRYLPGKVMGVVFEANYLAPRVRFSTIAFALLVQALNSNGWAGVFALVVLAAGASHAAWVLLLLAPAAALLLLAHRRAWSERMLLSLPFARRHFDAPMAERLRAPPHALLATTILVVEWIPFLAGWWILLADQMPPSQAALLGAGYLVASLASTALIVVPSGIVIREAMFVWIGARFGFPLPLLLMCGVVLRIALTLADVLNVGLFWFADAAWNRRARASATDAPG